MTLYELTDQYRIFLDKVESGEIPDEAIADTLESISGEIDQKIDSVACALKAYLSEAKAIKEEMERLAERKLSKERRAEQLRKYLSDKLIEIDRLKFESARTKISFRSSVAVDIADEAAFVDYAERGGHDAFLSYTAPTVNKTAVRDALAQGRQIPGAQLVKRMNLIIK